MTIIDELNRRIERNRASDREVAELSGMTTYVVTYAAKIRATVQAENEEEAEMCGILEFATADVSSEGMVDIEEVTPH